jgi:hypothetical protein
MGLGAKRRIPIWADQQFEAQIGMGRSSVLCHPKHKCPRMQNSPIKEFMTRDGFNFVSTHTHRVNGYPQVAREYQIKQQNWYICVFICSQFNIVQW